MKYRLLGKSGLRFSRCRRLGTRGAGFPRERFPASHARSSCHRCRFVRPSQFTVRFREIFPRQVSHHLFGASNPKGQSLSRPRDGRERRHRLSG